MTYIVDIDNTLLRSDYTPCPGCGRPEYSGCCPIPEEIYQVNMAYEAGNTIVLHTGRNWDCFDMTVKQLKYYGVKYHTLVMGKPHGIQIDADASKSIEDVL